MQFVIKKRPTNCNSIWSEIAMILEYFFKSFDHAHQFSSANGPWIGNRTIEAGFLPFKRHSFWSTQMMWYRFLGPGKVRPTVEYPSRNIKHGKLEKNSCPVGGWLMFKIFQKTTKLTHCGIFANVTYLKYGIEKLSGHLTTTYIYSYQLLLTYGY